MNRSCVSVSYRCKGQIRAVKVSSGLVAVGCTDGWIYTFGEDGLLWSQKLTATYYRGPYTDVNILTVDINQKYVAVGTDFVDGKVYLFSLDGKMLWYKQFLCIVGCWERPEDIVAIAVGKDKIAACSEWLNSFLYVISMNGDIIKEIRVEGSIKDVAIWRSVAVGTSTALYLEDNRLKIPVSRIRVGDRDLIVSGKEGVYTVNGGVKLLCRDPEPLISVSRGLISIATENKVALISRRGEVLWEVGIDQKPTAIFYDDENVYVGCKVGSVGCIYTVKDGEITERTILKGLPVYIGEVVVCIDELECRNLQIYRFL